MEEDHWPREYPKKLIIGDMNSNIGIATLWSTKEDVAEHLDPSDYCVVANFYDKFNAIEPMVRNLLSNTKIRYIIVIGNDLGASLKTIKNFFECGMEGNLIKNTEVTLPVEIPIEEIEKLRSNVKLFDLTDKIPNTKDFAGKVHILKDLIKSLEKLGPYDEPKFFPKAEIKTETFPSDGSTFVVREEKISQAWIGLLNQINIYGKKSKMSVNVETFIKECSNVVTVTNENPNDFYLPSFMKFDRSKLEEYLKNFCYVNLSSDNAYTYGNRLRKDEDQVEFIIQKLKEDILTKKGYATTWKVGDIFSDNPPCFISIQALVVGRKLNLTAYLRSNDMFRAYPLNAFGLRHIQHILSKGVNLEVGTLTTISHSAQIYEDNWKEAVEIVEKHGKKENNFKDIRGYYSIKVNQKEIVLKHFNNCGKELREIKGVTERDITDFLAQGNASIEFFHLSYLTRELYKAELCLKNNKTYIQDEPLTKCF